MSSPTETVHSAAIKIGQEVFIGRRHHDVIRMLTEMNYTASEIQSGTQGFLTTEGRFLTREEAAELALASGQITALKFHSRELFSEDLY